MPKWLENGTEDQVILDCDYAIEPTEKNVTIKWFFNSKNELIYEWIPDLDFRYVSGRLQGITDIHRAAVDIIQRSLRAGRFDWDFQMNFTDAADDVRLHKYRALAIRRPTCDLTGRYICQVVSSHGDDAEEATMVIYGESRKVARDRAFLWPSSRTQPMTVDEVYHAAIYRAGCAICYHARHTRRTKTSVVWRAMKTNWRVNVLRNVIYGHTLRNNSRVGR